MLGAFSVAFFGHKDYFPKAKHEEKLKEIIKNLIDSNYFVEFLVGRNGEFDQFATSTVLRVKHNYWSKNSALVWVMPYLSAEYRNNEEAYKNYYDEIEVCYKAEETHFKSAIRVRNHEMVDRADLIICYVNKKSGGAYEAVKYAEKMHKEIINLAVDENNF